MRARVNGGEHSRCICRQAPEQETQLDYYSHVEKCCALVCASPELFLTKPRIDLNITLKSLNWSRLGTVIIRAVECLLGDFLSGTRSLKYISPLDIFPPVLCFLLCLRTGRKQANASQTLYVFLVPDSK